MPNFLFALVLFIIIQSCTALAAGENVAGQWASPVTVPVVPSSGAVLPNGKVLLWAADGPASQGSGNGVNYSVLVDPGTGAQQAYTTALGHNMFCTGITQLADGRILVNGGGRQQSDSAGAEATSIYDPFGNGFSRVQDMVIPRGYNANTILSDGSVFTLGGSWSGASSQNRLGENWTPTGGWRLVSNVSTNGMTTLDPEGTFLSDVHFWMMPTGNGKILYAGPSPNMKWITAHNSGSVTDAGPRGDDVYAVNGTAVMYDAGKIFKAGGATAYEFSQGSTNAYVIDTTDGLTVTKQPPMIYHRAYFNGVALPDGKVMLVGGQTYETQGNDGDSILVPEIWNPATGQFSTLAPLTVPRNYHSIAMLLPDGRVMAAGGGLCSCTVNHQDYQIFSPPYLFDAAGNPAARPAIVNAPADFPYGGSVSVTTDSPVSSFSLVRMGAATHTVDNDQRRLPLSFTATGTNQYSLSVPSNSGLLLPGYWMLFAFNSQGVPSVSKIIQVRPNDIARLVSPAAVTTAAGQSVSIFPDVAKLQSFQSFGGVGLPPGLSVDPASGQISGVATAAGVFKGQLTASDGVRTVSTYLSIKVTDPAGHAPSVPVPSTQNSATGATVSIAIPASDVDGGPLTYSASGLPAGLAIDAASGVISGVPSTAGSYAPTVTVTDNTGLFSQASFAWLVFDDGRLALFSANSNENHGTGPFVSGTFTPAANSLLVAVVGTAYGGTSAVPNNITVAGGGLTWARQAAVSNSSSNEAALQIWTARVATAQPLALTLDEGADNVYIYMLQVRNYTNFDAISPFGGSAVNTLLSQPAGTMTLSSAPAASSEVIAARVHNASSGAYSSATPGSGWTELYDQYPFSGVAGLEAQVRKNSTSSTVSWTDVNDTKIGAEELIGLALEIKASQGPVNHAPTIATLPAQSSLKDAVISLAISASDPDGDALNYQASGLPAGLSIDAGTGVISGTITAAGTFAPTVTATDGGGLSASTSFAWTVIVSNPNNQPPSITAPAAQISTIGDSASLSISASDPDGDALAFSATGLPAGLAISPATGIVSGTITSAGTFAPIVKVTDPGGLSSSAAFGWQVADAAPAVTSLPVVPRLAGSVVDYSPVAANPAGMTYSWNFGDGSAVTAFSGTPGISHVYSSPGVYNVTLIVMNSTGSQSAYRFMQAIYAQPLASGGGIGSSTMAIETRSGTAPRLWVANVDNDSASVIDLASNTRIAEIPVGTQPVAIGVHPSGTIWVLNRSSASISIVDPATLAVTKTIALPRGSLPGGMVFAGTAGYGFVTLEGKGQLVTVTAAGAVSTKSSAVAGARFIATNGARNRLYISKFITPPLPGEATGSVSTVDANGQPVGGQVLELGTGGATLRTFVLRHSERTDTEVSGRGIPNYLGAAMASPDGASLWIPSKQDNIKRGRLRDGLDLNFQNTVRAIASRVNLSTGVEDTVSRVDLDNSGYASAAVYHPTGAFLFVALQSSREVAVVDPYNMRELFRFPTGRAPSSLAISSDGKTLYVCNFMNRNVMVFDLSPLVTAGQRSVTAAATVRTIVTEKLAPNVLRGKQFFYDAADTRMARDGYLSCAVCHANGEGDGRTWDFTGSGEGLRNTISLAGHGGMSQGFLHWSANFDEVQDFEGQIRTLAGGTGLMDDADFNSGTRSAPLGDPKAGLSTQLDDLAAYVSSLTLVPLSPYRNADGTLTAKGASGKTVFATAGCASCHAGTTMTISGDATKLKNVGTIDAASGKRLGGPLTGIDVPSLRGVWATAPYLHKGSAPDLAAAIRAHSGVSLTSSQVNNLVEYLKQIEQTP